MDLENRALVRKFYIVKSYSSKSIAIVAPPNEHQDSEDERIREYIENIAH